MDSVFSPEKWYVLSVEALAVKNGLAAYTTIADSSKNTDAPEFPEGTFGFVSRDFPDPLYDDLFLAAQPGKRREEYILAQLFCVSDQSIAIAGGMFSPDSPDDRVVACNLPIFAHDTEAIPYEWIEPVENLEYTAYIV